MEGLKEIKRRIQSIQSMSKLTGAMRLVSSVKLKNTHKKHLVFQEYLAHLRRVVSTCGLHALDEGVENVHVFFLPERGLCGAYKNAFMPFLEKITPTDLCYVVGKKHPLFEGYNVLFHHEHGHEDVIYDMTQNILKHRLKNVFVYTGAFKNTLFQSFVSHTVFPISPEPSYALVENEKEKEEILSFYLYRILLYYHLESLTCEHAARFNAMEVATKNAKDQTKKLRTHYNQKRQEFITRELIEIISGSATT